MKVLINCEESQTVCIEFRKRGHEAYSCDIQDCSGGHPEWHIKADARSVLNDGWDLMIAHPPCTDLCCSGAAWFKEKREDGRQQAAIEFFLLFTKTDIPKWCIENPIGIMSSVYRKPDQIIQPYQFGDAVKKTTCLWMRGLTPLFHFDNAPLFHPVNNVVEPELVTLKNGATFSKWDYQISMDHKNRSRLRSVTFPGIARAMAEQWG